MTTRVGKKGPVYVHFDDGQVFVTPQDYDQFLNSARPAIEALRRAVDAEAWVKSFFEDYIPHLHRWCQAHADKVSSCFVTLPVGQSIKAYVVVRDDYDRRLGEEIARLELELEDKGWSSDVMQLPAGEEADLQTFFKAEDSIQVYAEAQAAPR
jgi:hypothetical protein